MSLESDIKRMLDHADHTTARMGTLGEIRQSNRTVSGIRISTAEWDVVGRDLLTVIDAERTAILRLAREIDQSRTP